MILFVPKGSEEDSTLNPAEFDAPARFLIQCGVAPPDSLLSVHVATPSRANLFFP
jgi:hypothetical protein